MATNLSDCNLLIKMLTVLKSFEKISDGVTLSEDLFDVPNKTAFHHILHFLMGFVKDDDWLKKFPSVVTLMSNEALLKTTTKEAISRIINRNPGLKIRMLAPSNFPAPKGPKVIEFFLDLCGYIMAEMADTRFGLPKNLAFLSMELDNAEVHTMFSVLRRLAETAPEVTTQPEDFSQNIRDEEEELRKLEAEEEALMIELEAELKTLPQLDQVGQLTIDSFDLYYRDYTEQMTVKLTNAQAEINKLDNYGKKVRMITQQLKSMDFGPLSHENLLTDFAKKAVEKFSELCGIELYVDGKLSLEGLFRIAVEVRKQFELRSSDPVMGLTLNQLDQLLNGISSKIEILQEKKSEAAEGLQKLKMLVTELEKKRGDRTEKYLENSHLSLWGRGRKKEMKNLTLPEPVYAQPPDINSSIDTGGVSLMEWLEAGEAGAKSDASSNDTTRRNEVSRSMSRCGEPKRHNIFRQWLNRAGATPRSHSKLQLSERRATLASPQAARERRAFAPLDALRKPLLPTRLLQHNLMKKHPVTSSPVNEDAAFCLGEEFSFSESTEQAVPLPMASSPQNTSLDLSEECPDLSLDSPVVVLETSHEVREEAPKKRRRSLQDIISNYERLKAKISRSSHLSPTPSTLHTP